MVSFPNAKINIGLQVLGKRADGYHNLQTIFYPVKIHDALEIISNETTHSGEVTFSSSGRTIDVKPEDNLCVKAYHLIKKDFPSIPDISMHLHKNIPMGAGVGGGSADAAFVLTLLNKKFELGISQEKLLGYALQLGSDCPFFIINQPCFAKGRGELLEKITMNLTSCKIFIVNPGIHVKTAAAFKELQHTNDHCNLNAAILEPIENWKELIKNDFEIPVFARFPVLKEIKQTLYDAGALFALMSGSGSTIYGIFDDKASPVFNFPDTYFTIWV
jgi:4-diphosphocytidyl-2-C-methyl-D-erythritol kinase